MNSNDDISQYIENNNREQVTEFGKSDNHRCRTCRNFRCALCNSWKSGSLVINNGIGALEKAEKIENYYGLEHPLSGQELYDTGIAQAEALGVRILDAQVLGVGGFDTFVVKTTEGEFETQSLILATGSKRAAPKIPGVKEFEGKGVSYCAICDAFFYRGKDVAVLGNGDFAMHEAKELSNTASTVTIYTNGEEPEFTLKKYQCKTQ